MELVYTLVLGTKFYRFESYREYNIILIYSFRGGMESSILEYEDKTTVKIPAKLIFFYGVLVQLVRIHACHAWGHGFESRTHRK